MKKFLLLMFLLASSVSTAAETWVPISPPNEAGQSFYSPSSMRRSGDIVEVWSMHDLTKPEVIENRAVFSMVVLQRINCNDRVYHTLEVALYDGHAGRGEVASHTSGNFQGKFSRTIPGSTADLLAEAACKK